MLYIRRKLFPGFRPVRLSALEYLMRRPPQLPALLLATVLLSASTIAMATERATTFAEALEAARDGDLDRLDRLEAELGPRHPLQGYLDFHRLRKQLPDAEPQAVRAFTETYRDTPLSQSMERLALSRYAGAGRHEAILALRDTPPYRGELRCHWWHAMDQEEPGAAMTFAREYWQAGHSRPDACDPLFDAAREQGIIDDAAVWSRMRKAFRAGNPGLVRYLAAELNDEGLQQAGTWLRRLYHHPQQLVDLPDSLTSSRREELLADGLHQLASVDTKAALEYFLEEHNGGALSDPDYREIGHRIAWYSIIRGLPENRAWADPWIRQHGGPGLTEQRARRAIIEQDWETLPEWIAKLPAAQQDSSRWQYWLGRAHQERGEAESGRERLEQAARSRSFWGFVAAEHLGHPYSLSNGEPKEKLGRMDPEAPLIRIAMLREIGELRLARNEWSRLLRERPGDRTRLAAHAHASGWHELAVEAALQAGKHDRLDWRFPPAWRNDFMDVAMESGTDPYLLMAIARRESAFYPEAVSPAGALGLMQIMPGTARRISGWLGEAPPDREALMNHRTSIRLGSAYMDSLLERYQGNRLMALAAYNAGKHRVDDWLPDEAVPFDVWIESIPFHETRNYVQAVLAYRVLLAALDREPHYRMVPSLLARSEWESGYGRQLLADSTGTGGEELASAE